MFNIGDLVVWRRSEITHTMYEGVWEVTYRSDSVANPLYTLKDPDGKPFKWVLGSQIEAYFVL